MESRIRSRRRFTWRPRESWISHATLVLASKHSPKLAEPPPAGLQGLRAGLVERMSARGGRYRLSQDHRYSSSALQWQRPLRQERIALGQLGNGRRASRQQGNWDEGEYRQQ